MLLVQQVAVLVAEFNFFFRDSAVGLDSLLLRGVVDFFLGVVGDGWRWADVGLRGGGWARGGDVLDGVFSVLREKLVICASIMAVNTALTVS